MTSSRPAEARCCEWPKPGYRTGVIDLTAGEMGSRGTSGDPHSRRRTRQRRLLKLSHRSNMRFPDTKLVNWVEYREKLALEIRALTPRTVILPYWQARHPDHYHASEIAFDACFLAGLRKLDPETRARQALQRDLFVDVRQCHSNVCRRHHS